MLSRQTRHVLRKRLAAYPAVGLIGPRQCGKTTLARSLLGVYYDLEQPTDRLRLDLEWNAVVAGRRLVILDEVQAFPEVFARLRGEIDGKPGKTGRFLLLGSVSPALMTHVSQSLAGRLSLIELTPFLWGELKTRAQRARFWLCGGYPGGGVLEVAAFPRWQLDYLTLLAQRDLPAWGLPAKPQTTDRLLRMLAAVHGQAWNASQVGQSMGLSYHTVEGYLDYLVGAFLIRRLQPFHANLRKRLVKSPKLYWRDSGLVHALLNVSDELMLLRQPWVGASWEGFVIEQAITALSSRGVSFEAYHFRTSDQHELDLVLDLGGELWAIEIKLTTSPSTADMGRLDRTADMIGATRRLLISRVSSEAGDEHHASCNLDGLLNRLDRAAGCSASS